MVNQSIVLQKFMFYLLYVFLDDILLIHVFQLHVSFFKLDLI